MEPARQTVLLTLLSLSISIALVLAVDHLRNQARESFNKTPPALI